MKIARLIPLLFVCFCVGTVLAQGAGLAVVWSKGWLTSDRAFQVLAVLHGIAPTGGDAGSSDQPTAEGEQISHDDVVRSRAKESLNLTLRENAIEKGMTDLRRLEVELKKDRDRFDDLKRNYEGELNKLRNIAQNEALLETQRTLETLQPRQAKEQLLLMMDKGDMKHVVTIIKSMGMDKRKKILGEFKTPDESTKLYEILHEIRSGTGEADLIQSTLDQLEE